MDEAMIGEWYQDYLRGMEAQRLEMIHMGERMGELLLTSAALPTIAERIPKQIRRRKSMRIVWLALWVAILLGAAALVLLVWLIWRGFNI